MTRKQAQDHYLANRSRNLAEHDPHCDEFEEYYRPAFTYKALNRLIQGSAADMTKKAMVELYKKGIVPHIQIHDELCLSIDSEEKASMIKETMEKAIILLIPNKVNYKKGKNWTHALGKRGRQAFLNPNQYPRVQNRSCDLFAPNSCNHWKLQIQLCS